MVKINFSEQSTCFEYEYDNNDVNIMNVYTKSYDGSSEMYDTYCIVVCSYFSHFLSAAKYKNVHARLIDSEIVNFVLSKTRDLTSILFFIHEIDGLIEKLDEISNDKSEPGIDTFEYMKPKPCDDPIWDTFLLKKITLGKLKKPQGYAFARYGHRNYSHQIPCSYICWLKIFKDILEQVKNLIDIKELIEDVKNDYTHFAASVEIY